MVDLQTWLLFNNNATDMAQILQSLSYKEFPITLPKFTTFELFILILGASSIMGQKASCYTVTTSEIGLQKTAFCFIFNFLQMIEFLIDIIFVQFGGCLFRQGIEIPMGANCAPLLADLFLYSYENEFLNNLIRSGHRRLARSFMLYLCYRYADDLIVFNNKKFLIISRRFFHPSRLLRKLTNQITWQTTLISHSSYTVELNFQPGFMTNVMMLISTLSIFHSFLATYHLALLMVYTFRSS